MLNFTQDVQKLLFLTPCNSYRFTIFQHNIAPITADEFTYVVEVNKVGILDTKKNGRVYHLLKPSDGFTYQYAFIAFHYFAFMC